MNKIVPSYVSVCTVAIALFVSACGGSEPPPEAPPPPPPPAVPVTAPVATAAPAPVAPEPAPAPPAPPPKVHHHHGMAAMFFAGLKDVDLKPEQKTAIDAIEDDLEKLGDQHKELGAKLMADIADGAAAGKVDHKKTDADVKDLTKAVEGTVPSIQDAFMKVYKTLDADQRKKLVEGMRARAGEMHDHGMMGEHEHGMMGEHEHGMMGEHGGPPPGGPAAAAAPTGSMPTPPGAPAAAGAAPPPPAGPGGGPGMGHGPGDHGDHEHGPGMGHGPGGMVEHLSAELALTPEQHDKLKTKLEAQMKIDQAAMKAKMAAGEKQMKAIGDAFEGDKFDAKKAGVGAQAPEMAKTMAAGRVKFAETVLSVLTPEQRAKFADMLKAHAGDMD